MLADSNVLAPRTISSRCWCGSGPMSASSARRRSASRPEGVGAELECAFLNSFQARWQFTSDALGMGYAQGKSMMWRREIVEAPAA